MNVHDNKCLPSSGSFERRFCLVLFFLFPLFFGALALLLGQDANWDLRNYHWYNAYALTEGRYQKNIDFMPSQGQYFHNPLIDIPLYLGVKAFGAPLAFFLLSIMQGINYIFLFMICYLSMPRLAPPKRTFLSAILAVLGIFSAMGISEIGTAFYDNITSLGILLSAVLLLRYRSSLVSGDSKRAALLSFLFALPAGMVVGLKLTVAPFAIALAATSIVLGAGYSRFFLIAIYFGLGMFFGFLFTYGYWWFYLDHNFGNPFFPYFNSFFDSDLTGWSSGRDTSFLPKTIHEFFFYPLYFSQDPSLVNEIYWRDWRLPILYLLAFAVLISRGCIDKKDENFLSDDIHIFRFLAVFMLVGYILWMGVFSIYRYALPLEMLTPLMILLLVHRFPLTLKGKWILSGLFLLIMAASIKPGTWGRLDEWSPAIVDVSFPVIDDPENTAILMTGTEPYAHIVTVMPEELSFVRIQSRWFQTQHGWKLNEIIDRKIKSKKVLLLLFPDTALEQKYAVYALADLNLEMDKTSCRPVQDNLYEPRNYLLCNVERR